MHRGIFRRKKKQVIRGYATQHETGIFFWEAENIFWMKTTRREEETSFSSSISRSWGRTRLWRRGRRAFSPPPPFPILHPELIYPGDTAKKYRPGQESWRSNRATMGYLHLRREEGGYDLPFLSLTAIIRGGSMGGVGKGNERKRLSRLPCTGKECHHRMNKPKAIQEQPVVARLDRQ